ncbi:uncharacterized protein LOC144560889 [Carex rostrata]
MGINTEKWKNRWSSNEIIVLVLASLVMQIGLIVLAPLRKRITKTWIALILWLLYLTADSVATLALGNISNQAGGDSETRQGDLTVLWAPFLLLHLGGPDSITSYSIEDNELWWRHLLGLVVQVVITVYIFWQSPPHKWLWIPTIFVFIPGLIKFAERTHALRLGSKDNLKDKIISQINPANDTKKDELSEKESKDICEAYDWFYIFKRLLVDVTFSSNLLMQSQDRFSEMTATEALNMVAIELSFLYDILHTKAVHMHYNFNRVLRFSTMVSIIAALIVFHLLDKKKYASKDIIITYILFGTGLTLEVVAALLLVASDWTVVSLRKKEWRKAIACAITKMVRRVTFMKGKSRWSKTIGQFNLVSLCLRDRDTLSAKFMRIIKIKRIWDNMLETDSISLPEPLLKTMFTEAKRRAQNVHIYNVLLEARSYRGNKTLERHDQLKTLDWSMKREFDESIILWHVATHICYYEDTSKSDERDVSWNASNYMIYLLTQQQSMMQLGYGKTRFEATCSVVKKKLKKVEIDKKIDYKKINEALKTTLPPGQTNTPVSDDGREHGWRCWGKRKSKEDKCKNEGATPVPEQNEGATLVRDQNNTPVSDEGRQHGWRFWGKRKGKEDKRENEEAPPVVDQNEEDTQVPEQNNTPEPDDSRQHGWRCWGKCKGKEDQRKNEEAPPVLEQNEGATLVRDQTNTPVSDDSRHHGWICWGMRKSKEEKRKSKEEKLKDQEDMGKLVITESLELSNQLRAITPATKKWQLISETWMEMLGYAAIHCDSYQHAKSLSRGGELLTHLWLLMSQLGVVEEHKMQQYQSGSGSV